MSNPFSESDDVFVQLRDATASPGRSSSHATLVRWTAFLVAFLIVTLLVLQQSYAAFSATTNNVGNGISAGNISLADDDSGTALFNVSNATAGNTFTNCINVTYNGNLGAAVPIRLYSAAAPGGPLAANLHMTVEVGTGAAGFGNCTGFGGGTTLYNNGVFSTFFTTYPNVGAGLSTGWQPSGAGAETRSFRFTVTVDPAAAQSTATGAFGFQWEVQSV